MVYREFVAALTCVLLCLGTSESREEPSSSILKNRGVKLTINSNRNETGHWQSKVYFTSGGSSVKNATESWSLDIELDTATTRDGDENLVVMATITQVKPRKIPAGYELYPSVGYYHYYSENVIWADARQRCAQDGAHLVIVNSENEANVLKQFFMRYPKERLSNVDAYDSMWVGVYEQGVHGDYFTIFGEPLATTGFTRWHASSPFSPGTDECLSLYRLNAALYDLPCSRRAPFVCELYN